MAEIVVVAMAAGALGVSPVNLGAMEALLVDLPGSCRYSTVEALVSLPVVAKEVVCCQVVAAPRVGVALAVISPKEEGLVGYLQTTPPSSAAQPPLPLSPSTC